MISIVVSSFVKRQNAQSEFSHYDGDWEELEIMALENFHKRRDGYRPGVCLVPVDPEDFMSSTVPVDGNLSLQFDTRYAPRRKGEASIMTTTVMGEKSPAVRVDLVLYSHATLMEGDEATSNADWEIISINASPTKDEVPMGVTTMARNILCLEGGTDPKLEDKTKEELIEFIRDMAKSAIFWTQHVNVKPKPYGSTHLSNH